MLKVPKSHMLAHIYIVYGHCYSVTKLYSLHLLGGQGNDSIVAF